jgi:hypothetical protein
MIKENQSASQDVGIDQDKLGAAFSAVKQAMTGDGSGGGSYAHSWHCNIAMMCYDAIMSDNEESGGLADDTLLHERAHKIGNDAAARFMKLCFDVETSQ